MIMNNEQIKNEKNVRSLSFTVLKYVTAAVLILLLVYFGFTCEVREGNCAVIFRFGAPRNEITEAGLYFRLPWPFETVVSYDNRLQYFEANYLEPTTKDKRQVQVQSYVTWKISDPLKYHNKVGSQGTVAGFLNDKVFDATNSVMGAYALSELVSLDTEQVKTEQIQNEIFVRVRDNCYDSYGIEVVDVSILRLSLPDNNLESVFEQMRADRQKDIDTILANAQRDANKITSDADAEASKIISDGVNAAADIKAQTETEVSRIYAEAQQANLELYQFLKQLDTIVASVGESTVLVVRADEYPFKVLTEYGDYLTDESDEVVIKDLSYILTQLPEADRAALTAAIYELIAATNGGSQQ